MDLDELEACDSYRQDEAAMLPVCAACGCSHLKHVAKRAKATLSAERLDWIERHAAASIGNPHAPGWGDDEVLALVARIRELEAEVARLRVTLDTAASQAVVVVREAKTLAGVLEKDER